METREYSLDEMLNQPCRLHSDPGFVARHLLRDCRLWNSLEEPKPRPESAVEQLTKDFSAMMIVATVDKKEEKRIDHVVHATISQVSTKAFLPWSEKDIAWTQKDHPKVVKEPG